MQETKIDILIKKFPHLDDLSLPFYATSGSAGVDLLAAIEEDIVLKPNKRKLIPTGIAIALPHGYEAQVRSRSGLASKHGIVVLNSPGTIDSDYRGEISILLMNFGEEEFIVRRGSRIAQMVIAKYIPLNWNVTDELPQSNRGGGGLGSTGY